MKTFFYIISLIIITTTANAGRITVAGDVNISDNSDNDRFFHNVIGDASNVMFRFESVQWSSNPMELVVDKFESVGSISTTNYIGDLCPTILANVDLLVLSSHINWGGHIEYNENDLGYLREFLDLGGDIFLYGELIRNSTTLLNYNDLLTGIGSSIQFKDERILGQSLALASNHFNGVPPVTPLSVDQPELRVWAYNNLTGGQAVYTTIDDIVVVATEVVSVNAPSIYTLTFITMLGLIWRKFIFCRLTLT